MLTSIRPSSVKQWIAKKAPRGDVSARLQDVIAPSSGIDPMSTRTARPVHCVGML
jgi:hypothetical protein